MKKPPHKTPLLWAVLFVALLAIGHFCSVDGEQPREMPFSDFMALVQAPKDQKHVEEVEIRDRDESAAWARRPIWRQRS